MKKVKWIVFSAMTLFLLGYIFFESPILNPFYYEGAVFYCVAITAYVLVWALLKFGTISFENMSSRGAAHAFNYVPQRKFPKWVKILIIAPWAFLIVMTIGSSVLFHSKAYRDQLGVPEVTQFSTDVQPVDVNQIPIVDKALALKLADKKLGERQSLGSQVVLGVPTIQMVDGNLIWAVPLHHSGFFKWLTNMSGTPGYIVVSATDVSNVDYVDGKPVKYHPGSYFMHDLKRKVRLSGALFEGITDYSFELDDSGQPYWVVSTYKNRCGFNLPEATGVIVLNATTGEMQQYGMDNVPEWVDRIQPENYIINQINNQGEYVHGIFNFPDKDKFRASDGSMIVYNNGNCYLFTGLTSVGQDDSTIGYVMVDMRTKHVRRYEMNGATERAAQNSAQGKVQHLAYSATFPLILNVNQQPTYFMTLKDKEGLIKQYAMVMVTNYSVVGTGETIPAAIKDYQQAMRNMGLKPDIGQTAQQSVVTGTVLRIAAEDAGDGLTYKLLLEETSGRIFTVSAELSEELALTQPGDRVRLEVYENTGGIVAASSFDNEMFSQG